ncbi:lysoplasmalogenase family protein [Tamlana crocina]
MGAFRDAVKEELVELFSQKKLANLMFFGIVFLDALGAVFPEYLNRKITLFIPFPLILVIYLASTRKVNKWFVLALVLNFFGICYFNNPYQRYDSTGLVFHAMAYLVYCFILFRPSKTIGVKKILFVLASLALLVLVPLAFYYDGIKQTVVFNATILYVCLTALYILSAVLVYISRKTETHRFLLFSAISILLSSYFQGYNLFMEKNDLLNFFAVICFNLAHYLMCCYLVQRSEEVG